MGSQTENTGGLLYIVSTPIGNLQDITIRALDILKSVSVIACEDTRQTQKLLYKYDISKKMISYFHPRENQKVPLLLGYLRAGRDVALVSDAGTPGVSDPGYPLIKRAIEEGIRVIPIPGASAVTASLSAAGLPSHRFIFLGFPPPKKGATRKQLESLENETGTLIYYLPPRKLESFLSSIAEILGARQVVVAREMTKLHEEFLRGTAEELIEMLTEVQHKGEATVLIQGKTRKPLNLHYS